MNGYGRMIVEAGGRRYELANKSADSATFLNVFEVARLNNVLHVETIRLSELVLARATGKEISRQREKVARLEQRLDRRRLTLEEKS